MMSLEMEFRPWPKGVDKQALGYQLEEIYHLPPETIARQLEEIFLQRTAGPYIGSEAAQVIGASVRHMSGPPRKRTQIQGAVVPTLGWVLIFDVDQYLDGMLD
jgi:hypothetical protein